MVEGNIIQYDTLYIDTLLQGLKCIAQTCIDRNLRNQKGTVRIFRRKLAPIKENGYFFFLLI